jgi:GR25 family glycosyltransferase involved in LPS biosynthesis
MFEATYVINLDRSTDRWEALQPVLRAMGVAPAIRWSAVDALELGSIDALRAAGLIGRELFNFKGPARRYEIACALSHQAVLREIVRTRPATALILEDDVALAGDPVTWLQRCREAYADLPTGWELWYLYRCLDIERRAARLTPRTVRPWMPLGGAAYVVTPAGAERLLEASVPVATPIDWAYAADAVRRGRVAAYAASPRLVLPGAFRSIIREAVDDDPFVVDGVTVPPEYWPAELVPTLSRQSRGQFGPFRDLRHRIMIVRRRLRRSVRRRPVTQ